MIDAVKEIKLADLLKQKCVYLNIESVEKPKIVTELVDFIADAARLKNKKALLTALVERERLGSTAIGNGVAIPHTKIEGIKEPILAFARSPQGVDFNSLDGELTYIFFVLISPKEEVGRHLKVLARISHIVKDKFTVGRFKKAKNAQEVMHILEDAEGHLKG